MKVSVIVPVYNLSGYIDKSLESLEKQTIFNDLKIIIIDDCSTDNSYSICRDFLEKHPENVILLKNDENKGVSYTRNRGLDYADTDYLIFFDADDIVCKDFYQNLLKTALSENADMVIGNICYISDYSEIDNIDIHSDKKIVKTYKVLNRSEAILDFYKQGFISNNTYTKLFRRETIKNLKFDENLTIAEDMLFVYQTLLKVSKVVIDFSESVYFYLQRPTSAMRTKIDRHYNDHFIVLDSIINVEQDNRMKSLLIFRRFYDEITYVNLLYNNKDNYRKLLKECRRKLMRLNKSILLENMSFIKFVVIITTLIHPKFTAYIRSIPLVKHNYRRSNGN